DASFFETLYNSLDPSLRQEKEFFQHIVYKSCSIKAEIVSADEREGNIRAILNFGHTLGHALEAATRYSYFNHGEAVNYGMLLASRLALREGLLKKTDLDLIEDLLYRLGFVEFPGEITVEEVIQGLQYDKKRKKEKTIFILPEKIGRVGIYDNIAEKKVEELLQDFFQELGKY
ncbi:MAG: 3-dehydroquinate synthase, partial [Candidatus Syntrophonatronum acetioxidans]